MSVPEPFNRRDRQLFAESVALSEIGQRFGTPCFVYSRAAIDQRWSAYQSAIQEQLGGRGALCYAVKANGNLALLGLLAQRGAGFDIVSGGELARVLRAGGQAHRVVFSGVGKATHEIRRALLAGIRCFNVESTAELERIAQLAAETGATAPVALRVNPDVDAETHPYIATGLAESKFGIPVDEAEKLYRWAAAHPHLDVRGVAFHIGSQLLSLAPLREAARRIAAFVERLRDADIPIAHVDVGGGLGVRYVDETPPQPAEHVAAVAEPFAELDVELLFEPGRAIVAEAGVLLTRVEYLKTNGGREFAVVDAGMNDYLRPALYHAAHTLEAVVDDGEAPRPFDVVGPVCESADRFASGYPLSLSAGDYLVIRCVGAYGAVMASQYNGRPRPAEILVAGDHAHLIRRRETVDELMRSESIVPGI